MAELVLNDDDTITARFEGGGLPDGCVIEVCLTVSGIPMVAWRQIWGRVESNYMIGFELDLRELTDALIN